jgi:hypothetical protein
MRRLDAAGPLPPPAIPGRAPRRRSPGAAIPLPALSMRGLAPGARPWSPHHVLPSPAAPGRAPRRRRWTEPPMVAGSIAIAAGAEPKARSRRASACRGFRARARSGSAVPPRDVNRPFTIGAYAIDGSMRSWESVPPRRPPEPTLAVVSRGTIEVLPATLLADRLPGSHGPSERRVNAAKVNARLTPPLVSRCTIETLAAPLPADRPPGSRGPAEPRANGSRVSARLMPRRPAAIRKVARRGRLDRARPCRRQPWVRPRHDSTPGADRSRPRRAGPPGGDRGHHGTVAGAELSPGSGRAAAAAGGAWRWRRRAS